MVCAGSLQLQLQLVIGYSTTTVVRTSSTANCINATRWGAANHRQPTE